MTLRALGNITDKTPEEILDDNLQNMLEWEFLNNGGFVNINIPTSGTYGGQRHRLSPARDNNFDYGRVWQTYHKNLVWESGVSSANTISGVFVNNVFQPLNSGYYIDYPNGKVVFDSVQATNSTVEMEYSHKLISVEQNANINFFKRLQDNQYRVDNNFFHDGSGNFLPNSDNRAQVPVIGIESYTRTSSPYALGGYSRYLNIDVKFSILSSNEKHCKRLGNILADNNEKRFNLYNSNTVAASGAFPLDYRGNISTGNTYVDLNKLNQDGGYRWAKCEVHKSMGEPVIELNSNLYMRTITWNTRIVLPGV